MTTIKRAEKELTLSVYAYGQHRISGHISESDIETRRLSFLESLSPIIEMIHEFHEFQLGSKIKVIMEIEENK